MSSLHHRRNINQPGHAHELTFSGFRRFPFLRAERTCEWLRDVINTARVKRDFWLWAWVFMPEHVHLLIYPRQKAYDIADIRHDLKSPVGSTAIGWLEEHAPEWLPRITRQRGDKQERLFWQSGGGYDRNVTQGKTLLAMIDYIHLNPVRRGLVERPEDGKWSSAAWYLRSSEIPIPVDPIPPDWLEET